MVEAIGCAPARIYPVACKLGLQVASPFWSTVAKGMTNPTHEFGLAPGALLTSPTHQLTSLLVSDAGDGGALNVPVAVNWNCPLWAVAIEGCRVTLSRWRPPPQPRAAIEKRKRAPTERGRNPGTIHLRTG